jgi:hypothetical protein
VCGVPVPPSVAAPAEPSAARFAAAAEPSAAPEPAKPAAAESA